MFKVSHKHILFRIKIFCKINLWIKKLNKVNYELK